MKNIFIAIFFLFASFNSIGQQTTYKYKKNIPSKSVGQQRTAYEKNRIETEKIEKYNNSDLIKIKLEVHDQFQAWLKKDEFETSEQHENRIRQSAVENFEKINADVIQRKLKENNEEVILHLGSYNADKEYFPIKLQFKDLTWNDIVRVTLDKAKKYKDEFYFENQDEDREMNIAVKGRKIKIAFIGWRIYENNFYPTKILVKTNYIDNTVLAFVLPISNLKDYKLSANSLGLNASNLSYIEFNYTDYQKKIGKGSGNGEGGVSIRSGLGGRMFTHFPSFEDDFNESAKVAVDITVDQNGIVQQASINPHGTTTTTKNIRDIALRMAKQLKLNAGKSNSQSGTIVFNFKLSDGLEETEKEVFKESNPNGNPNSDSYAASRHVTNSGVGGGGVSIRSGLGGRRFTHFPSFEDDFNESAKVAIDITVDQNGNVQSASINPHGTTTANQNIRNIALRNAKLMKLNAGKSDSETGTIVFNFKLKG